LSESFLNDTSAQLDCTVPFKLDVLRNIQLRLYTVTSGLQLVDDGSRQMHANKGSTVQHSIATSLCLTIAMWLILEVQSAVRSAILATATL